MPPLTLRRAVAADAPAIRDLTRAAYAKWVPLIGREPKPMTADYDRAVRDHLIDVHEVDGAIVALVEVIPETDCLLIENIAVRPDRHGQGLGDQLLRHAEDVARRLGHAIVRLYTNGAFATNIAFYARRGYAVFDRAPLPAGGEVVHMRKHLSPP